MNELLTMFTSAHVRYLLVGDQAMRLTGMPRFSMDWDFFIPPRDEDNFQRLNTLLEDELDAPIVPLGPQGENFIQTYQTRWGVIQSIWACRGFQDLMRRKAQWFFERTKTARP